MDWAAKCAVVLPCFNEGVTIGRLVGALRQRRLRVIVLDDGSTDDTAVRAAEQGARVVPSGHNRGKGAALQTGLGTARHEGFDWALTMDGDGQHQPEDIPAFWRRAAETDARLVIGNRMPHARALPPLRRFVNRWLSRQLSRRAVRPLPDSQCGFRLLELRAWSGLALRTEHFEIESEMLLAFLDAGHRVEFVPIQVVGAGRRSKIRPVADSWRWFRWWRTAGRAPALGPVRRAAPEREFAHGSRAVKVRA